MRVNSPLSSACLLGSTPRLRAIAFTSWSVRLRVYSETRWQEFDYRRDGLIAQRGKVGIEGSQDSAEAECWFCRSDGDAGSDSRRSDRAIKRTATTTRGPACA